MKLNLPFSKSYFCRQLQLLKQLEQNRIECNESTTSVKIHQNSQHNCKIVTNFYSLHSKRTLLFTCNVNDWISEYTTFLNYFQCAYYSTNNKSSHDIVWEASEEILQRLEQLGIIKTSPSRDTTISRNDNSTLIYGNNNDPMKYINVKLSSKKHTSSKLDKTEGTGLCAPSSAEDESKVDATPEFTQKALSKLFSIKEHTLRKGKSMNIEPDIPPNINPELSFRNSRYLDPEKSVLSDNASEIDLSTRHTSKVESPQMHQSVIQVESNVESEFSLSSTLAELTKNEKPQQIVTEDFEPPQGIVTGYALKTDVTSEVPSLDINGLDLTQEDNTLFIRRPPSEIAYLFKIRHPDALKIYQEHFQRDPWSLVEDQNLQWMRFQYYMYPPSQFNLIMWVNSIRNSDFQLSLAPLKAIFPLLKKKTISQLWKLVLMSSKYNFLSRCITLSTNDYYSVLGVLVDTTNELASMNQPVHSNMDVLRTLGDALESPQFSVSRLDSSVPLTQITHQHLYNLLIKRSRHSTVVLGILNSIQSVNFPNSLLNKYFEHSQVSFKTFESFLQHNRSSVEIYTKMIGEAIHQGELQLAWKYYCDMKTRHADVFDQYQCNELFYELEALYGNKSYEEIISPQFKSPNISLVNAIVILNFLLPRLKNGDLHAQEIFKKIAPILENQQSIFSRRFMELFIDCHLYTSRDAAVKAYFSIIYQNPHKKIPLKIGQNLIQHFIDRLDVVEAIYKDMIKSTSFFQDTYYDLRAKCLQCVVVSMILNGRNYDAFEMIRKYFKSPQLGNGDIPITPLTKQLFILAFNAGPRNSRIFVELLDKESV